MNRKIVYRWVKVFLLIYCVIGIAFFYAQDALLFHPEKEQLRQPRFSQPSTQLDIRYDASTTLNVVEFKATDRPADSMAKGVVLYFPESSGNVSDHVAYFAGLTARGYEVWNLDYPGFGKSVGDRSENRLYAYALVFYKLARARWKPSQIVIYGQGFGTGIAAQLASVRNCRRLILEDPYYSVTSRFRRFLFLYPLGKMLHYHLPLYRFLPAVTDPITIYDGDSRLRSLLKPGDTYFPARSGSVSL
jgi:pimeloyl-ACP methyl ester carboxylesterase